MAIKTKIEIEVEKHRELLENLTNADLKDLLEFFRLKKSGNRQELMVRVNELMDKNDKKVLTKIRQLYK